MSRECNTGEGNEKCIQNFGQKGRDHLKELNIDVRVMLQCISRKKS
jgi:hypothetical protein